MQSFYLDSCIWLNLFKKEGDSTKGIPYWKIAEDLIKQIKENNNEIIVSSSVLKELSFKAGNIFKIIEKFFEDEKYIKMIEFIEEDYTFARKLESKSGFEISFYDCLHIAMCKRLNFILVTRDNLLIDFARDYIEVQKPENLVN